MGETKSVFVIRGTLGISTTPGQDPFFRHSCPTYNGLQSFVCVIFIWLQFGGFYFHWGMVCLVFLVWEILLYFLFVVIVVF